MTFFTKVPLEPKNAIALEAIKAHAIKPDTEVGNHDYYLSLDPGKVTGFATFGHNGMPTSMGHIGGWSEGILSFLRQCHPKVIIYEGYQIRGRAQDVDANALRTRRVVKTIRDYAKAHDIQCVEQQAAILGVAKKFSGMEMPGDHSKSHQISAFNHGWYRLTQDKVVIPRILWPEG